MGSGKRHDRRSGKLAPAFPFIDSNGVLVKTDRRRVPGIEAEGIEVDWQNSIAHDTFPAPQYQQDYEQAPGTAVAAAVTSLLLTHDNDAVTLDPGIGQIEIGRAVKSSLTLSGAFTSRLHLRFEFVEGQLIVSDLSKNGTYIHTSRNERLYLRNNLMALNGSGVLGLGVPPTEPHAEILRFTCL